MVRLVIYLLGVALIASGLSWLADRPGTLQIAWQGYEIETTVFRATLMLAAAIALGVFLWSMLRLVWNSPSIIGERIMRQRKRRGFDAIGSGLIAIGAGDKTLASRHALSARKSLPYEPLTHLLRAQAAELAGDRATARRIYESMLASPETEQLGLRGLYLEAEREGADEAARQYAARALKSNSKLGWSAQALFELQCKDRNWAGALETLGRARRNELINKQTADRRRAVLLTAQAIAVEDDTPDEALTLAMEAHALASDLSPAAAVAGRIFAARGQTGKAAKVIQKTWVKSPHPDLAAAYAYARIGDSAQDRLDRIRQLAALNPGSIESPIAVATTAIEARLYSEARAVLEPLSITSLTQRVAILMARIEAGENRDKGRVREWLARAAHAARDPVWIADGVISDRWEPSSPVTGKLDAFQWRAPTENRDEVRGETISSRIEELLAISASSSEGNQRSAAQPPAMDDITEDQPVTISIVQPSRSANAPAEDAGKSRANGADRDSSPDSRPASAGKADPKLFVAPRAPDDPGADSADDEAAPPFPRPVYRSVN
jgi:HemY protein